MDTKFRVLRIIGTLWKVLAWIVLVGGILFSLGLLLVGLLGSGGALLRLFGQDASAMPSAMGIVSSLIGFVATLIATIIYFLILYAVGDLIYLLLAIEENTRRTVRLIRDSSVERDEPATPPPPSP
jgi:hypothetical protein